MNEPTSHDRRSFLRTMGTSSALVAAVPVLWKATTGEAAGAPTSGTIKPPTGTDSPNIAAGRYSIELDGALAGWVQSADGGSAVADVVVEKLGAGSLIAKKHIGNVKYEDISISCGTGMSKGFYQWIKDSMDGKAPRKNGAVRFYPQKIRFDFANALGDGLPGQATSTVDH